MSDYPAIAVTERRKFCCTDEQLLFTVNANVPVSDALELATTLLGGATRLLMNHGENPDDNSVTQSLLEFSKALMDASLAGIWAKELANAQSRPSTTP